MLIRVADYILTLEPTVITFPSDLNKLSQDFEKVSGFPGVVGCLDGSYVEIQCPSNKVAAIYCNRHHHLSLTLQAVCDNKRRFVDTCVGCSSRIHDSRVFRKSSLVRNLPVVCQAGKYHVLGDAAYPVRQYLLTPFRDYGGLWKQHRDFNAKFSATGVLIENAFGILKKRFRQLIYLELRTVSWLNKFTMVCCILHNLCIDSGDIPPDEPEDLPADVQWVPAAEDADSEQETAEETALRKLGELKREKVFEEMMGGRK
ncbi:hypothetical protein V5799_025846 [Amblyomma americanum]|uniref:DDE Tnp4 domain-containing protein n=1 Tax=Amblyomma americanum TaxID=6943 RepID=A0AAQ4E8B6_AMBAM